MTDPLDSPQFAAEHCGNCRFSIQDPTQNDPLRLLCRRFPPTVMVASMYAQPVLAQQSAKERLANISPQITGSRTDTTAVAGHFPIVQSGVAWCGEWRTKETVN
jgi:hypothetical protein